MNIARIFAHAFVRRIAFVVAAAVLAWFGLGKAHSAEITLCGTTYRNTSTSDTHPTRQEAYQHALNGPSFAEGIGGSMYIIYGGRTVVLSGGGNSYHETETRQFVLDTSTCQQSANPYGPYSAGSSHAFTAECPSGGTWNDTTKTCALPCSANDPPLGKTTLAVPAGTEENPWIETPNGACVNACSYTGALDAQKKFVIDGQQYITYSSMEPTGEACTVGTGGYAAPSTAPPDADGDGASDGNDAAPANPGISTPGQPGPDGSPPDGTSTDPGDGSGNGNQSVGGGSCSSPPSSNGDAILAQIAYQAWATRCAVEGLKGRDGTVNVSFPDGGGGDGSGTGSGTLGGCTELGTLQGFACTGDPVGCIQAEAAARANCRSHAADVDGNGQPDWTQADGPAPPDGGDDPDVTKLGIGISPDFLDQENIFGAGTCPVLSIKIMGFEATSADIPYWCTLIDIMRAAILIMSAYTALQICLGRWV